MLSFRPRQSRRGGVAESWEDAAPSDGQYSENAYVLTALSGTLSCSLGAVRLTYCHGDGQRYRLLEEVVYTSPSMHTLMGITLLPSTRTLLLKHRTQCALVR